MDLQSLLGLDQVKNVTIPQSLLVDDKFTKNTIGADRFDCTHIKHSLQQSGVCILPLLEAVAHCNAERDCGGYGVAANTGYHNVYDLKDHASAAKFFKGTKILTNNEWTLFVRQN
ncbi:unnamed protein product [Adineta steineri]|uniref:Uncharacterized protein n=1 Tax=Adineta steineri TaxID=433720 RepID=A0A815D6P4_9BILA|nr:unnamed protein product [Adineta steineri]CAF1293633.1 unnamed protein product [Adineta steineri]CAF3493023.1 unnamed protein product [Adineta steineri]CAF3921627.1 unnamed protein product [Adineta steineri]